MSKVQILGVLACNMLVLSVGLGYAYRELSAPDRGDQGGLVWRKMALLRGVPEEKDRPSRLRGRVESEARTERSPGVME